MGKQKKKRKNVEVDLLCEWSGCSDPHHADVDGFMDHLKGHIDSATSSQDNQELVCEWFGCAKNSFSSLEELKVHISYHGFHTKLMSFGLAESKMISENLGKEVVCTIDGSTRNLLPPLPDMFVCGWKDCLKIFYEAEEFYQHVEEHPFEPSNKSVADVQAIDMLMNDRSEASLNAEPCSSSSDAGPNYIRPVKCYWFDCNFISDSNSHIAQHLRSHTQEKTIACPNCGAMFSIKGKFRDHLLRQLEDYDDQTVNEQKVTLEINDQEIMVTIHPNLGPAAASSIYKCDQCDRTFHSSSLLKEHNRRHFHYHRCDICGKTTDSPSALSHHKAYRHNEDRPFACQFCSIKCKTRSDLRRHLETHSKSNPFKCNQCKFECRCCHTLAKHMKRFHQTANQLVNEYLCHECAKKFTRGNNLTRHLISIHGYTLKPGQSRFNYVRDNDGVFTLAPS